LELDNCRAENVARPAERGRDAAANLERLVKLFGAEAFKRAFGVMLRVER
jgi:hypothetical protein